MKLSLKRIFPAGKSRSIDLIMIHGTGANADMWRGQMGVLQEAGYRCFLPELRGHGDSPEPGQTANIEAQIEDMLETLAEAKDIRFPAIFIGHSLGAILSLEIAERRPELVKEILAIGMPGKILPPVAVAFRWFLQGPYHRLKGTALHGRLPWRERTLLNTQHYTLSQIVDNFQNLNYVAKLPDVACPVHFSVGRFDPVAPAHYVTRMHKALPTSTLRIFEFAGHNCMDERPKAFNTWLLGKLEALESELEGVLEPAPEAI